MQHNERKQSFRSSRESNLSSYPSTPSTPAPLDLAVPERSTGSHVLTAESKTGSCPSTSAPFDLPVPEKSTSIKKETRMSSDSDGKDFRFPFSLPSYFSGDVEADLESKVMTSKAMAAFMTTVAHSVFAHKRYPNHSDFEVVARSVVDKYPFLSSASENGYEHISGMLKDCLKRVRRKQSAGLRDTPSPSQATSKKSLKSLSFLSSKVPHFFLVKMRSPMSATQRN